MSRGDDKDIGYGEGTDGQRGRSGDKDGVVVWGVGR